MSLLSELLYWGGILFVLVIIIWNIYQEYRADIDAVKEMKLTQDQISQDWRDE